ncbi:MAG: esterase/lipase family protein [Aeromicrobium sp.]
MTVAVVAILAVVAAGGVVAAGQLTDDRPVAQGERGPVLVVPGYGGNMVALDEIVATLREQGREVVAVRAVGRGTGDLRFQAERLDAVARRVLDRTGAASVDVVGFSAGGVVARLWVKDGGRSLVRRVLTIGSPHHGTDTAALAAEIAGSCSLACEQLVPDSDLLRQLNTGDETPDGPEWISIASNADQTVTPTATASLDGALNLVVQDLCPERATVHGGLPRDPVVLAALTSALGNDAPKVPTGVSC